MMKANLKKVNRKVVDPKQWSSKTDPVTWEDMGSHFRLVVQCSWKQRDIALHCDYAGLGDSITNAFGEKMPNGWQEHFRELIRRRFLFVSMDTPNPYCSVHSDKPLGGQQLISPQVHKWLMENLGRLFFGYMVGEQEGRYLGNFAKKFSPKKEDETTAGYYVRQFEEFAKHEKAFQKHLASNYSRDRREACRDFMSWMRGFEEGQYHRLSPLAHTNYIHYLAELNEARILGAELALIMLNHQVFFAYMRGAARQYGLLFWTITSVWTRWGLSAATAPGQTHIGDRGTEIGLDKGISVELARRIWLLSYMYGASMLAGEFGYFERGQWDYMEGKTETPPALSELGKLQVAAGAWCKNHPDRGVPYTPIAVMLDFYNGWSAPKHGYQYTGEKRLVWNALPYEKGDHQIDNFFRWLFPGYEECAYHRDGTGTFVATPYGDLCDVLLNNADPRVIKQYQAIILLGEDVKVSRELKDYVRRGGDLIVSCQNMEKHDEEFYGARRTGRRFHGTGSKQAEKKYKETAYTYDELSPVTAQVLLESDTGCPLVTVNKYGNGRVIVMAPDYGMTDLKEQAKEQSGLASQKVADCDSDRVFKDITAFFDERNWDCPYNYPVKKLIFDGANLGKIEAEVCGHCRVECTNDVSKQCDFLEGIKAVLEEYFHSFLPVRIEGPPVHYLLNVTEDKKKIIVTLANHEKNEWQGKLVFKESGLAIKTVREWVQDKKLSASDLHQIKIAPKDIRIFEIIAQQDILP